MPISKTDLFKKWNKTRATTGYRSQFEASVAKSLPESARYEPCMIPYSMTVSAHYKPDFILPDQAIVIEAKGRFTIEDRSKMMQVKRQYPSLDIRILFQSKGQRITKLMTAEDWCRKAGFPCAQGPRVPSEWLEHKPASAQRKAFDELFPNDTSTA